FYSFDGEAGGLLNIVLDLSEARTQLTVKRPSQLFYDAVSHANVAHEPDEDELDTGPFLLTESGEWVVELSHPSRAFPGLDALIGDRKSTRLNSSHVKISYAVFCLKKKK